MAGGSRLPGNSTTQRVDEVRSRARASHVRDPAVCVRRHAVAMHAVVMHAVVMHAVAIHAPGMHAVMRAEAR